jgi:uncharacterized protein YndB with AHSA1/START domain
MFTATDTDIANPTGFTIDRETHTIRFTRTFDAPAMRIFEAWTRPEHMACWWDATGERLDICEIDLRPGGAFRFVSRHHPDRPFTGTYQQISPPNLLVFDANGAIGRVMLDGAGGGTNMTVEITCRSSEHLDQYMQIGVHLGTSRTLDNLVAFVDG